MGDERVNRPGFRRVAYGDHAEEAARRAGAEDPGRTAAEAVRLAPLQEIQVAFEQLVTHARARERGEPWLHTGGGFGEYTGSVLDHARRRAETLRCAADAADAMIGTMTAQLERLDEQMAKKTPDDEPPKLTPSGAPHPLQEGGYDQVEDPGIAPTESDVNALKSGHATQQQAEALASVDVPKSQENEEAPGPDGLPPDESDAAAEEGEDEPADEPADEGGTRPKRGRPKKGGK